MSQLTSEQFETITATFERVFGVAYLFRNQFKTRSFAIGLVGLKDGSLDWEVVARRCEAERRHGDLRDPVCRHAEGVAMLYVGAAATGRSSAGSRSTLWTTSGWS